MRERYLPPLLSKVNTLYHVLTKKARGRRSDTVKKMGRPKADKPKEIKYSIRTDAETESRLEKYCAEKGISKGEAYRKGIELLLKKE